MQDSMSLCSGDSILIDAGSGFVSYSWNTGETYNPIMTSASGLYIVDVVHRTEDIVSKIEGDLLGIDVASVHPDGKQVQLWETLEKMLFQTRLKAMTEKISKTGE